MLGRSQGLALGFVWGVQGVELAQLETVSSINSRTAALHPHRMRSRFAS